MNTFGNTGYQFGLVDPRSAREDRKRFRRAPVPNLNRANSLSVPSGCDPARGWFLLPRGEYDLLDPYDTDLRLHISDTRRSANVGAMRGLAVVQAQCVTRGIELDPDAIYLVEVTDARGVLHNEWFSHPLVAAYNIRSPAYPQTFQPSSMNGGTTWTWSTMLQDIWEGMTLLGTWPGLPYSPAGTPEGFWFTGVPAWPALCDVLDHLGLVVACDLTQDSPYTIVRRGAADATHETLTTLYTTHLEDDLEWLDVGAGRVPKTVTVLFRRRNATYGTEETTPYRNDAVARQWNMGAVYSVPVTATGDFASAVGEHHLWSDFTVRHDHNGDPLAEDVTTAATIAAERATDYYARIYSQTLGRMSHTYAGALPFATGSRVDGVRWSMDHSRYGGWTTEVSRGVPQTW